MNGIASLLDQAANNRVENLWQELDSKCGLIGVKGTPFPHFSWQVTEGYTHPHLESSLQEICSQTLPFTIHTDGIGIFTGEKPVIFITIFRDQALIAFHSFLWEKTKEMAIRPSAYYAPDQWVPHITLAYEDVRQDNLSCALQTLAFQSFDWEIKIDNLVFVGQTDNLTIKPNRYQFGN